MLKAIYDQAGIEVFSLTCMTYNNLKLDGLDLDMSKLQNWWQGTSHPKALTMAVVQHRKEHELYELVAKVRLERPEGNAGKSGGSKPAQCFSNQNQQM